MRAPEKRKATALLNRYYKAAVEQDGAAACSMLFSVAAKEVVEEQARWHVHGSTCPAVVSAIFRQRHRLLVADQSSMRIVRARVYGLTGCLNATQMPKRGDY